MGSNLGKEAQRLGRLEKGEGEERGDTGLRGEKTQMCAMEREESNSRVEGTQGRKIESLFLDPNPYDPHFLPFIRVTERSINALKR